MSPKRRVALGCLSIVAAFILYRFIYIYRWRAGDCATGPQPRKTAVAYPPHLLVMTYNIEGDIELFKGPNHIEEIAKVINEVKPDIVGLNEVHRHTWQSRFHDQVGELQRMTHMNGAFGRSYSELGGAFGNAVLTRGAIVSADVHNLPAAGEPRSLFATTIRIDQATINFYVGHVAAWGPINSPIRSRQLECLASHVRVSKYPHILAGDFNAPPSANEIASFRNLNTTLQICGPDLGATQKIMNQRLDYIFADRGWQVRAARVLDGGPSDHRPVIAELFHEAASH
jgi:endonuclease/exonuclease/phosphatase family metal-dependent hydrolase